MAELGKLILSQSDTILLRPRDEADLNAWSGSWNCFRRPGTAPSCWRNRPWICRPQPAARRRKTSAHDQRGLPAVDLLPDERPDRTARAIRSDRARLERREPGRHPAEPLCFCHWGTGAEAGPHRYAAHTRGITVIDSRPASKPRATGRNRPRLRHSLTRRPRAPPGHRKPQQRSAPWARAERRPGARPGPRTAQRSRHRPAPRCCRNGGADQAKDRAAGAARGRSRHRPCPHHGQPLWRPAGGRSPAILRQWEN